MPRSSEEGLPRSSDEKKWRSQRGVTMQLPVWDVMDFSPKSRWNCHKKREVELWEAFTKWRWLEAAAKIDHEGHDEEGQIKRKDGC